MIERRKRARWPWWSTTRWAVALFTLAEVWRIIGSDLGKANWPEAFICFCILFALPIDGALSKAPAAKVVEAVTGMFGKPVEAGGYFASTTAAAFGAAPNVLDDADLMPPVSHGRPEEES